MVLVRAGLQLRQPAPPARRAHDGAIFDKVCELALAASRPLHLHAAGADLTHLVQVTIYIAGIDHWPLVNTTYAAFLAAVPVPPARAVVPVPELHYGALVEMQAIAIISV